MTNVRLSLGRRFASIAILLSLAVSALAVPPQEPITFAAIGDSGEAGSAQRLIARRMKTYRDSSARFDFVLMLGDNIYPDGAASHFREKFEEPYRDLLDAGVKFYASLGNHDIRRGAEDQPNYAHFNMGGQRFYSFTKGDGLIEFFALDSTPLTEEARRLVEKQVDRLKRQKAVLENQRTRTRRLRSARRRQAATIQSMDKRMEDLDALITRQEEFIREQERLAGDQISWLRGALTNSRARWKVPFFHHAIYSSARTHGTDSGVLRLRALLEPIFIDKKVDVVFAGHDHVYERTKPQGPASGHKVYYFTQGASAKLRMGDLRPTPFFEKGNDQTYSFLVVKVSQNEMNVEAVDPSGNVLDSFRITKSR